MKTNTVTLTGTVVVTQGQNVVRGDRLTVDLTTGVSRVEGRQGRRGAGRERLFYPNSAKTKAPPGTPPRTRAFRQDAPKTPAKNQPMKLN